MTVHARQLARLCRERMAACDEESLIRRQPEQQQAAEQQQARTAPTESTQPLSREEVLR